MSPRAVLILGLGTTCAALALCVTWLGSTPLALSLLPPEPGAVERPVAAPRPLPMLDQAALQSLWQKPLFSARRQADSTVAAPVSNPLQGLSLAGVVLSDQGQWALLNKAGERPLKLKRGATLEGGWTLSALDAHNATFSRQGIEHRLSIPVLRLPAPSQTPPLTLPDPQAP